MRVNPLQTTHPPHFQSQGLHFQRECLSLCRLRSECYFRIPPKSILVEQSPIVRDLSTLDQIPVLPQPQIHNAANAQFTGV